METTTLLFADRLQVQADGRYTDGPFQCGRCHQKLTRPLAGRGCRTVI